AAARALELRVDVILEIVESLGLQPQAIHVAAGILLQPVDFAERAVLHEISYENAQTSAPGAFDALPVRAFMCEPIPAGPAVEIRPPFGGMVAKQVAGGEQVLGKGERAVEVVIGAVGQGVRRAVSAPGPSAVKQSAEKFEGGDVNVCVDKAP